MRNRGRQVGVWSGSGRDMMAGDEGARFDKQLLCD